MDAQLTKDAGVLRISTMEPPSPGKLPLGEKLTLNIQYINSGESPVRILAIPYTNGIKAPDIVFAGSKQLNGWDEPVPKGAGTVARWFYGKVPQEIDEVEISMWDLATKKLVSVLKTPVRMTWSGSAPASTAKSAPNQPAGQQGKMRFELQGYEVSQDAAAKLFISQPGELDPKSLLTATAALVGARKAALVKLPFIEAASGARAVAAPVGGYSLEAELTRGAGGYVNAIYALRRASDQSGTVNGVLSRIGGITFMGSLPGSSADNVVLMFARISEL